MSETPTTGLVPFRPQAISFPVPEEKIAEWAKQFLPLKVEGLHDQYGLAVVHKARMEVKDARVAIEARRKELKADALAYGKAVDSAARALVDLISPIEAHLLQQEKWVEEEKKRLADEEEARRKAAWESKIRKRIEALAQVECVVPITVIESWDDEEFDTILATQTREFEYKQEERKAREEADRLERERLAKERAELERQKAAQEKAAAEQRRLEEEKLAAARAELDAERKRQQEAQAALDAEKRRLEAAERERVHQAELEAERRRAAEEARLEALEEQRRAEREAKERAEAEERERKRIEALKPDHEKLMAVADAVAEIKVPALSLEAELVGLEVASNLDDCVAAIRDAAHSLIESDELETT